MKENGVTTAVTVLSFIVCAAAACAAIVLTPFILLFIVCFSIYEDWR